MSFIEGKYGVIFEVERTADVTSIRTIIYGKALVDARLTCHSNSFALRLKRRAVVTYKASTSTALKALVLPTQKFQNSELPTQPNNMAYRRANTVSLGNSYPFEYSSFSSESNFCVR